MRRLELDVHPGQYSITRLDPAAPLPAELLAPGAGGFVSVTRTPDELSLVCPAGAEPAGARIEAGFRLLTVRGPLEFSLTGIVAAIVKELTAAGIALFTISTFDTDHVLVKDADLDRASAALRAAGHEVHFPA